MQLKTGTDDLGLFVPHEKIKLSAIWNKLE
jgi:hypothetical protein